MFLGRQDRRPKVRATCIGNRRDDFSHAQADEHGEEADHDPSHRHHPRSTCSQTILEERGYAGDDGYDAEGDTEIMQERPVPFEILSIAEFTEAAFILGRIV